MNGQDRGDNNTRVDGAPNILVTMPHHMVYVPPVESIEEVNISTNNFDAEQGMTGGAAVTVTTKSGTNQFHGSAFAFHTNNALRAYTWDENRAGVTKKPKGIRNIDGGSVGGPIKKSKLFFFTDWEGTFERVGRSALFSVPAGDFRTGDFSRKLGAAIYSAERQPHYGAHHGRGLHATPPGNGLRSRSPAIWMAPAARCFPAMGGSTSFPLPA